MVRKSADGAVRARAAGRGEDAQVRGHAVRPRRRRSTTSSRRPACARATYTLKVVDLPYVQKLELEYHFPAYTGLEPRKIEDGGDIAVLRGTEVRVQRRCRRWRRKGGQVAIDEQQPAPLTVGADGTLDGEFVADNDGFYRIELDAPTGERVTASPQYTIDVLTDQPPTVSISKPGRDTSASPIEEVFVEARAEDDYGVKDLELVYSVNGGAEKTVRLFDGSKRLPEVTAGHTFYLEELGVQAGRLRVVLRARRRQRRRAAARKQATSDIYFLQVRPLRKDFKRAESKAGGGGGGGGSRTRSARCRSSSGRSSPATFNIQRDRKTMSADKLKESSVVVGAVADEAARAGRRTADADEQPAGRAGSGVQEDRRAAAAGGRRDEDRGRQAAARRARTARCRPSRRRCRSCRRPKRSTKCRSACSAAAAAAAAAGRARWRRSSPILFELELDKMANQYETAQRAEQQQTDQKVDELVEKLKELARRQEQEAERQRQRALAGQQGGGGGDSQQRALAEQVEEAARRLEQLSREENRADLAQTARQLREAADAMRQAAANGDPSAAAQARRRSNGCKEAERKLQQAQSGARRARRRGCAAAGRGDRARAAADRRAASKPRIARADSASERVSS